MPSIALLEFDPITPGIVTADAMVKRAPLEILRTGTVQPGRFLVLVGGGEAEVVEALAAARAQGEQALRDIVHLPDIHPAVFAAVAGVRATLDGDALAIVETATVPAAIAAADAALKGTDVRLGELRLADGLGGKGLLLLSGEVAEVEAAIELALRALPAADQLVAHALIPRLHPEMAVELIEATRFRQRVASLPAAM